MRIVKSIVFSFLLSASVLPFSGCESMDSDEDEKGTKVLVLGDEFARPCLVHLPAIATDLKVELDLAVVTRDGFTLAQHDAELSAGEYADGEDYPVLRNRFGKRSVRKSALGRMFDRWKWDVVVVQQAGTNAHETASYNPAGASLVEKIRARAPQARLFVQEMWSPTPWDERMKALGLKQDGLSEKLRDATASFAKRQALAVIPVGTAIQQWRSRLPVTYTDRSLGGDVVGGRNQADEDKFKRRFDGTWEPNCNLDQLNQKGEFLQALVWAVQVLDVDMKELKYRPDCVTEDEAKLMREIATGFKR